MEDWDKIESLLREVGGKVEGMGEAIWPALVKREWAEAVAGLSASGVCLLVFIGGLFFTRWAVKKYREAEDPSGYSNEYGAAVSAACAVLVLSLIIGLCTFTTSLPQFIAPEAEAFDKLLWRLR